MFVFLLNMFIICAVMMVLFRYMYPKPPKAFMPTEEDDTSLRVCDYCQHTLATYRGIVVENGEKTLFFCNEAHQAAYEQAQLDKTSADTLDHSA